MFELYKVEHLKDSAITHIEDMNKVAYSNELKLLSYDDFDIKIMLNSMAKVRTVDENNYKRAVQALDMNMKLDSLIRSEYLQ
jgi:protein associated with RNAse G/E